ncbi:hormogonium polysaccharide biosynthesis glycosyltransferase HpsE [Pseudanabaena sp. FACHB-2040]|uniref:hormogonium polysaccharide biosynthesis glycosyltransferase HpsE n=1 Tax=Pseudanabaena sp. FACHB-2040 TaxID=2692859 RepID=UPI001686299F|nr:hormogonium polysaccharide biosynthesis glycosyltransferase HpsE [Pseudanabaena sp. FACHB-2040]MBD2258629.1 glycosyltransferase family 2 protein [Pseudanabaena sp. FACHB-2040]
MVQLTVAIRAYNAASRLPKILDCLQRQVVPAHLSWEVLVVDNNSTDDTPQIIDRAKRAEPLPFTLKYVLEDRQGAAFARQRALLEAGADLVGFLDDDNYPAPNWVAEIWEFGQQHPGAGAFSGKIFGDFEVPPPPNFAHIASYMALIDRGDQPFSYSLRKDRVLPPGAGLVIRKSAWLKSVPKDFSISGPVGHVLALKGEDIELLGWLRKAGWEILYNPNLVILHHIPAWRLERDYLLALVRSIGLAQHLIRMQRLHQWQRPFFLAGYMTHDFLRMVIHYAKYYPVLSSDVVAACQLEKLRSALVSPFYRRALPHRPASGLGSPLL